MALKTTNPHHHKAIYNHIRNSWGLVGTQFWDFAGGLEIGITGEGKKLHLGSLAPEFIVGAISRGYHPRICCSYCLGTGNKVMKGIESHFEGLSSDGPIRRILNIEEQWLFT